MCEKWIKTYILTELFSTPSKKMREKNYIF